MKFLFIILGLLYFYMVLALIAKGKKKDILFKGFFVICYNLLKLRT